MSRFLSILFLTLAFAGPAGATVELSLGDRPPVAISEVYQHQGTAYLPLDDVLPVLELSGKWDSVAHVYHIKTPMGRATISPGSHFLRLGERFIPLDHPPRFIDGRLRVSEEFLTVHFPNLVTKPVYYRNLNPQMVETGEEESPLDRLFAFLLSKKKPASDPALRGLAIDPGHGGQDAGSLGTGGLKEKAVVLEVARRLEKQVKMHLGIPVYLSRDSDYVLTLQQRLEPAMKPEVDALIQLHAQASLSPSPHGISLVVRPQEESEEGTLVGGEGESMRLARSLREAFETAGFETQGIYQAPLIPLGRGNLPTVLVELGYLSNPTDLELLKDPQGQQRLAVALFEGLKRFSDEQKETTR